MPMQINPNEFIFTAVTLGGLGVTLWGWRVLQQSRRAGRWPSVEGEIVESRPGSPENDLLPHIVFRYRVGEQEYQRPFRFPEGTHPLPEFTEIYLKKYPVGKRVAVYYDPEDPSNATLEPRAHDDWMILAAGIVTTIGGALALLLH